MEQPTAAAAEAHRRLGPRTRRVLLALGVAIALPLAWWLVTWGLDLPVAPALGVGVVLALWIVRVDLHRAAPHLQRVFGPYYHPITALAKALAPLLIAPLAILVLVSRGAPPWAQVLIGAAAVLALVLVVQEAGGRHRVHVLLRLAARRLPVWLLVVAAVVVVLGILVVAGWIWSSFDTFKRQGDWAAVVFGFAVGLWAVTLVFRLLGHARRPLRIPVVLVLLAVTLGLLAGIGILPAYDPKEPLGLGWKGWAWVTLGVVLVCALLEGTFIHLLGKGRATGWRLPLALAVRRLRFRRVVLLTRTASRLGFVGAALSALLVLAAAVLGQHEVRAASNPVRSAYDQPQEPSVGLERLGDQQLADLFAPILAMRNDERWGPTSVDDYLKLHAVLLRPRGFQRVTLDSLPRSCPNGRADQPCYTLTCSPEGSCEPGSTVRSGPHVDATIYAHVIRFTHDTVPLFAVDNPYSDRLRTLVQYWLFYPYDLWRASVAVGRLVQQHEGDWESVTVGLGERKPLFVAYSQHCAGVWADWSHVEADSAADGPSNWATGRRLDPDRAIHPLIAVARGSHANYPRTAEKRASDWASCRDIPEAAVAAISYASNIRDLTGDAWRVYPKKVAVVTEGDPPMTFPGHWGASDLTTLRSASLRTLNAGPGPTTPPLKALWKDPLTTIFHGPHWREAT